MYFSVKKLREGRGGREVDAGARGDIPLEVPQTNIILSKYVTL